MIVPSGLRHHGAISHFQRSSLREKNFCALYLVHFGIKAFVINKSCSKIGAKKVGFWAKTGQK